MFYLFLLSCYQIRISGTRRSLDKIKKELDKCVILCANCHREEHERIRNN
jgi:ribosomal protein L30E